MEIEIHVQISLSFQKICQELERKWISKDLDPSKNS